MLSGFGIKRRKLKKAMHPSQLAAHGSVRKPLLELLTWISCIVFWLLWLSRGQQLLILSVPSVRLPLSLLPSGSYLTTYSKMCFFFFSHAFLFHVLKDNVVRCYQLPLTLLFSCFSLICIRFEWSLSSHLTFHSIPDQHHHPSLCYVLLMGFYG